MAAPGPLLHRSRSERGTSPDLDPERAAPACAARSVMASAARGVVFGLVAPRMRPFIPDRNMNHRGLVLSLSRRNASGYLKCMSRRCASTPLLPVLAARVPLARALLTSLAL